MNGKCGCYILSLEFKELRCSGRMTNEAELQGEHRLHKGTSLLCSVFYANLLEHGSVACYCVSLYTL